MSTRYLTRENGGGEVTKFAGERSLEYFSTGGEAVVTRGICGEVPSDFSTTIPSSQITQAANIRLHNSDSRPPTVAHGGLVPESFKKKVNHDIPRSVKVWMEVEADDEDDGEDDFETHTRASARECCPAWARCR